MDKLTKFAEEDILELVEEAVCKPCSEDNDCNKCDAIDAIFHEMIDQVETRGIEFMRSLIAEWVASNNTLR